MEFQLDKLMASANIGCCCYVFQLLLSKILEEVQGVPMEFQTDKLMASANAILFDF